MQNKIVLSCIGKSKCDGIRDGLPSHFLPIIRFSLQEAQPVCRQHLNHIQYGVSDSVPITDGLHAGDGYYVAPSLPHGFVCLEAGVLIDTFTPMREDFLK